MSDVTRSIHYSIQPRSPIARVGRILGGVALLLFAVICAFGFLESFAVPGLAWKVGYALAAAGSVAFAVPLFRKA